MATVVELFDAYLASQPRAENARLDVSRLHETDRIHLEEHTTWMQALGRSARQFYPSLPEVHFFWLDEVDLNGIAFRSEGRYFIGLTYGIVQAACGLFNTMLSSPQVLPDVGDPSATGTRQLFRRLRRWGRVEDDDRIDTIRPACPLRTTCARHLENIVVEQCICHEFTHILHGHTGYFDDRRNEPEVVLTTRTAEMDADIGALSTQMRNIVLRVSGQYGPLGKFAPFYDSLPGAVFDFAYALGSIFHIFGNYFSVNLDKDMNADSETIFRMRLRMVMEWIMQYVRQFVGIEHHDSCARAMLDGIEQARHAYAIVTDESRDMQTTSTRSEDPEWDHLQDLVEHWRGNLRAQLEPYAFRDLPRF